MVSRRALVLGTGAGVSAFALGRWAPGTGDPGVGRAAWGALDRTLSDNQREQIFLPWDHPSRQLIHNVPIFERPHLGTLLSAEQQSWVRGGFDAMLSGEGRRLFRGPLNVEAGGLDGCVLLCYGTRGVVVEDDARYRIAGLDYFVDHEAEEYAEYVQRQGTGLTSRETLVRQVREAGRIGSAA